MGGIFDVGWVVGECGCGGGDEFSLPRMDLSLKEFLLTIKSWNQNDTILKKRRCLPVYKSPAELINLNIRRNPYCSGLRHCKSNAGDSLVFDLSQLIIRIAIILRQLFRDNI